MDSRTKGEILSYDVVDVVFVDIFIVIHVMSRKF